MSREVSASASVEFRRFVVWVFVAAVAIGALGYLPTRRFGGDAAVAAMLGALGAATLASIIGGVPIFAARLRGDASPKVVLTSMLVRLGAVVLLAAFVALALELPTGPFLIWLALAYLLLLVVDTRYSMSALGGL